MFIKSRKVIVSNVTPTELSPVRSRGYFSVQNKGAVNNIFIGFDTDIIVAADSITLGPGEFYDIQVKNDQKIFALAATAPVDAIINEG